MLLAVSVQVDIWALIGGLSVFAAAVAWLVALQWKHKAHEDLCAQRYSQIESTHSNLVKAVAERHEENVTRFTAISRHLERQDDKLDRLLERVSQ